MKYLLFFILLPFSIFAFEPHPVTPFPVVGLKKVTFYDDFQQVDRELLAWYPVDPLLRGLPSNDPWDVFNLAVDAPVFSNGKLPVVVISHGYLGSPQNLSWLILGLVHNGFIVLGMQHRDLMNGKLHVNYWQRAQDVHLMIDQFAVSSLGKSADLKKIGFAGFSLGGTTGILVLGGKASKLDSILPSPEYASHGNLMRDEEAFPTLNKQMMAKDWRDRRIKAGFLMAPAFAWLFEEDQLRQIKTPTYLIAAAEDQVLVTKNNAGFFARSIPNAFFQVIPGKANHYIFVSALNDQQRKKGKPSEKVNFLLENDVSIDRSWIQTQVVEEAARFFGSMM
jgi:predicted dienelactone hydrolase